MLDIAPSEFLLIGAVAIVVIGPKDMPRALRMAGRWMGKMRRMSNHLRSGLETIIREAELEEMEAKWRAQNEEIMRAQPGAGFGAGGEVPVAETPVLSAPDTTATTQGAETPPAPVPELPSPRKPAARKPRKPKA